MSKICNIALDSSCAFYIFVSNALQQYSHFLLSFVTYSDHGHFWLGQFVMISKKTSWFRSLQKRFFKKVKTLLGC